MVVEGNFDGLRDWNKVLRIIKKRSNLRVSRKRSQTSNLNNVQSSSTYKQRLLRKFNLHVFASDNDNITFLRLIFVLGRRRTRAVVAVHCRIVVVAIYNGTLWEFDVNVMAVLYSWNFRE